MKTNKKFEIDMCNGNLLPKILKFALPLMLSGILQLLFNAADMIVVGKFAGKESLAAVGSTSSLINLLVNLFMGLSVGCNVLVARYYGSEKKKEISDTVHTSITIALISGVILGIIGIVFCKPLLILMGTPEDVLPLATLYMRIYFAGMPVILLYNFSSAILRAVGDTMRPLIFLSCAGVINILLNLFFVIVFKMDVAGVALATVISQAASATCVMLCLIRDDAPYRLSLKKLGITKKILVQIIRIGLPAGLQGCLFSISNVMIQSGINSFGTDAIAGNTAACNLEGFVYTAMNSFHQTAVSFTGQNTGAGKMDRVKKVLIECLALVTIFGLGLSLIMLLFGRGLLTIYADPEDVEVVVKYGLIRMAIICPTYFTCGTMDVLVGSLRGMGKSILPMIVSLCCVCVLRIILILTVFRAAPSLQLLYWTYPISWVAATTIHFFCFVTVFRRLSRQIAGID